MSTKDINALVTKIVKHPILMLYLFAGLILILGTIYSITDRIIDKLDVIQQLEKDNNKQICDIRP